MLTDSFVLEVYVSAYSGIIYFDAEYFFDRSERKAVKDLVTVLGLQQG